MPNGYSSGNKPYDVIYNDGTQDVYITPTVKSVEWSGDIRQAYRKLTVEVSNTTNDGINRLIPLELGKQIRFVYNGQQLFTGAIFADEINLQGQSIITAYDENVYLVKNTDTKRFEKLTATAIIKRLCDEFGIPAGELADTSFVIPKLILRDKTLYDMMVTALTETERHTGKRFILFNKDGKLQLAERREQVVKWVLENGVNIMDATYSRSIEGLKTQVKVIGGDIEKNPIIATVKNNALIEQYGIMQHLENADADVTQSQINQLANQLLADLGTIADEAGLECLGIPEVISGASIYVYENMTWIVGGYYVSNDVHRFEGGLHTMDIRLSATDDLPIMEYEPQKEAK